MNITEACPAQISVRADRILRLHPDAQEELAARRRARETGLPHTKRRTVNGRYEPHGPYHQEYQVPLNGL